MDEQQGIVADPLFGGLTRPPTFLGLPIEAMLAIMGVSVLMFLIISMIGVGGIAAKLFPLGLGVVFYGVARLVCATDPRAFRYMSLRLRTKSLHRTKDYWQSGSYAPQPNRRRK